MKTTTYDLLSYDVKTLDRNSNINNKRLYKGVTIKFQGAATGWGLNDWLLPLIPKPG